MTAPFSKAVATQHLYTQQDGTAIFRGHLEHHWSVFGAIHGGYLIAVITDALSQWQSPTFAEERQRALQSGGGGGGGRVAQHPDPAHLMTQYMGPCKPGVCEIRIKATSTGKSWSNLSATLHQPHSPSSSAPLISVLALYTLFPSLPSAPHAPFSTTNQSLLPLTPSPYSRQSPFLTHPALCSSAPELKPQEERRRWARESVFWFMEEHVDWALDGGVEARRKGRGGAEGAKSKKDGEEEEGEGEEKRQLEWAAWLELKGEGEGLEGTLPFWADIFSSIPELFPEGQRVDPHYYPTLAMSIQFHTSLTSLLSSSSYLCAPQTVGCYSTGSLIHHGRHEQLCEVWSAPGPIGSGEVQQDWRARTFPLLTSTQIALSVHTDKLVARKEKEGQVERKRVAKM